VGATTRKGTFVFFCARKSRIDAPGAYTRHEESLRFALDVSYSGPPVGRSNKMDKTGFESIDQTAGKDKLFKLTLESLFRFYFEFRIKIEGAKSTPFARAHLAL